MATTNRAEHLKLAADAMKQQEAKRKEAALFEQVIGDLQKEYYARHIATTVANGYPEALTEPGPYQQRNQEGYSPTLTSSKWGSVDPKSKYRIWPNVPDSPVQDNMLNPQEVASLVYAQQQLAARGIDTNAQPVGSDGTSYGGPKLFQMQSVDRGMPKGAFTRQYTANPESYVNSGPAGPPEADPLQVVLQALGLVK